MVTIFYCIDDRHEAILYHSCNESSSVYFRVKLLRNINRNIKICCFSSSLLLKVLPSTDTQILDEEGVGFVITLLLYILSIGIVWILTIILAISIFWFDSTVHKIFLRYMILSKEIK